MCLHPAVRSTIACEIYVVNAICAVVPQQRHTDFAIRTPAPSILSDQSRELRVRHGCESGSVLVARHVCGIFSIICTFEGVSKTYSCATRLDISRRYQKHSADNVRIATHRMDLAFESVPSKWGLGRRAEKDCQKGLLITVVRRRDLQNWWIRLFSTHAKHTR